MVEAYEAVPRLVELKALLRSVLPADMLFRASFPLLVRDIVRAPKRQRVNRPVMMAW